MDLVTALVDAIKRVVGDGCSVIRYSDLEAARSLWSALNGENSGIPRDVVIVFDGLPTSWSTQHPFRPELWLTPWDWALAVSTKLERASERPAGMEFRCWIVDLLPGESVDRGRKRFKTVGAFVPWVRTYRPLAAANRTLFDNLANLWGDIHGREPLRGHSETTTNGASAAFETVWLNLFSAPDDRHAIGNLVGPLLLAEGLRQRYNQNPNLAVDEPTTHFRTLLRTVGLSTSGTTTRAIATTLPLTLNRDVVRAATDDCFHRFDALKVWLVDDQCRLGYHDILSHILFGGAIAARAERSDGIETRSSHDGRSAVLRSYDKPLELMSRLQSSFANESSWRLPRTVGQRDFDILLLDLRLFPTSSMTRASEDERTFLSSLIDLATKAGAPADVRFTSAVESARRRAKGGREELQALTLLPLLLSYADPSVPIVVFSSTHQQEVLHAFRERPNIVTSFSKPIVTGYASGDAGSIALEELLRSISEAIRLHRIRPVWEAIARLGALTRAADKPVDDTFVGAQTYAKTVPLKYLLRGEVVQMLQAEFVNLIAKRRYADALMAPHNILESCFVEAGFTRGLAPTDQSLGANYLEGVAHLSFYRVLHELRNARAHYQCSPMHDDDLEDAACWSWLLFVHGCCMLVGRRYPVIAGAEKSTSQVDSARRAGLLPLEDGESMPPTKRYGAERCRQIISKFGELLNRNLIAMPTPELRYVAEFARRQLGAV